MAPAGDLTRAAQTGDHRAFTTLILDSDERMRRLAYRLLGSQAAMDDALQDAYLKAFRKIGTYDNQAAFSTWLYTIVYRTCLDHLRSSRRRNETTLDLTTVTGTNSADPTQQHVDADALAAALDTLPPDQIATVLLIDGDGFSYTEAALVLGVRQGTIASRLNRAHTALRTLLDEEGTRP